MIDAEFDVPPERIKEFQVQFRPFEEAEIKDIALNPRATGKPSHEGRGPASGIPPVDRVVRIDRTPIPTATAFPTFKKIHKYRTDPKKFSTAGDGVSDGDRQRRREFTYTIRSVVKVMPPVNLECLNDDYQDARVLSRGENFVELEVIHYPLEHQCPGHPADPDWRRDAESKQEYLRPGITTNWDDAMRRDLIAALKADGIDPDRLDDKAARHAGLRLADGELEIREYVLHALHALSGRPRGNLSGARGRGSSGRRAIAPGRCRNSSITSCSAARCSRIGRMGRARRRPCS